MKLKLHAGGHSLEPAASSHNVDTSAQLNIPRVKLLTELQINAKLRQRFPCNRTNNSKDEPSKINKGTTTRHNILMVFCCTKEWQWFRYAACGRLDMGRIANTLFAAENHQRHDAQCVGLANYKMSPSIFYRLAKKGNAVGVRVAITHPDPTVVHGSSYPPPPCVFPSFVPSTCLALAIASFSLHI